MIDAVEKLWDRLYFNVFLHLWVRWKLLWNGQQAVVISGFPAVGKTTLGKKTGSDTLPNGYTVVDLDALPFARLADGKRNPDFPRNYMQAILQRTFSKGIVLITSHEPVRQYLASYGVWYTLIYPMRDSKMQTVERLKARGDPQIALVIDKEFDNFMDQLENQGGCQHRRLQDGEFLEHVVDDVVQGFESRN